jgi:hypothetical protein
MDYAAFKTYLTTFLWKAGDAVLIANLDNLIRMANHELNRILRVEERHASDLLTVNALNVTLPTDYHSLRALEPTDIRGGIARFTFAEPARLIHMRRNTQNRMWIPYYSIQDKTLMFSGPVVDSPIEVYLSYNRKVPDFQVTDTSWLADTYLDIYTYGVLKQASMFLREDERLAGWKMLFDEAIMLANDDSEFSKSRGPSAPMPLPRTAGSPRRKR